MVTSLDIDYFDHFAVAQLSPGDEGRAGQDLVGGGAQGLSHGVRLQHVRHARAHARVLRTSAARGCGRAEGEALLHRLHLEWTHR